MRKLLLNAVCAAALVCASGGIAQPARAQADITFDSFHDALASQGDWVYSDRWGEVWLPDVPNDFQPYGTNGYWAMTDDYGWTWVSGYSWGDIPFHYGRWVDDPDDGWLWIPGYVWSPAWVVWRSNAEVTGWMPMPPDPQFLRGAVDIGVGGLRFAIDFNDPAEFYGYRRWYGPDFDGDRFAHMWVFVGNDHFADRDFNHYERPRGTYTAIIHNTTNITNYTIVNNVIVNKSVSVNTIERASGHPIHAVAASAVMHHADLITHVDQGRHAQEAMRSTVPRGGGTVGSAPRPSPTAVASLSDKAPAHHGAGQGHVFTRQTVQARTAASAPMRQEPNQAPGGEAKQEQPQRSELREEQQHAAPNRAASTPSAQSRLAPQPEQRPTQQHQQELQHQPPHPEQQRPAEQELQHQPQHSEQARPAQQHQEQEQQRLQQEQHRPAQQAQQPHPNPAAKPPAKENEKKEPEKREPDRNNNNGER